MPADSLALVSLAADGNRTELTFGEIAESSSRLAGHLASLGVERGDAVLTLIGSRPEWVLTMLACWRIGAVPVPCNEMLTEGDLAHRIAMADPKLLVIHESHSAKVDAVGGGRTVICVPDPDFPLGDPIDPVDLEDDDPAVVIFTSGTSAKPKGIVHGHRWLAGQQLQASEWFGADPGTLAWCTAAPGWSKSARNVFLAPWLCGAAALIHEGRFDPAERLEIVERERVATLCQAPTEFRVIAASGELRPLPHLRSMVAAGEALGSEVIDAFREATGVKIRDGYGQTETNHLTAVRPGDDAPTGSMGRALSGVELSVVDGELVVNPRSVPTFFVRTLEGEAAPLDEPWHTGDLVDEEDGWFFFRGRTDDMIGSSGYRIGPLEVEAALASHPAVAESAVVGEPDAERGEVVRAVVVLNAGFTGSDSLVAELQTHVKGETAPYKYPRIVEFADSLPRTDTGKLQRSALRRTN